MSNDKKTNDRHRRVSTPAISENPTQDPFNNFRSLRTKHTHRSHSHLTKKPEISIILEVDTDDNESSDESKSKELNKNSSRPVSMNSLKFDIKQPVRMGSARDSRRSTKSIISTKSSMSTKSLDLTKLSRHESNSSRHSHNSGHTNNGFQHSNNQLNRSTSSLHSSATAPVVREQYFCCRKWSKREKILTTVVATLILVVCGLAIVIGFIAEKRAEKNRESFMFAL